METRELPDLGHPEAVIHTSEEQLTSAQRRSLAGLPGCLSPIACQGTVNRSKLENTTQCSLQRNESLQPYNYSIPLHYSSSGDLDTTTGPDDSKLIRK